jgi:hypothetical protein
MKECEKPWLLFEDAHLEKERLEAQQAFWSKKSSPQPNLSHEEDVPAPQCTAAPGHSQGEIICLFHGNVSMSGTIELAQCKLSQEEPTAN